MLIRDNVYGFWIKMPIEDELASLDPDAGFEIESLKTTFSYCGLVAEAPTKLVYCKIETAHENPLFLVEAGIISFELDWEVYHAQSAWDKVDVLDDEGNPTGKKVPEVLMSLNEDIYTYVKPQFNTDAEGNQTTQKPYDVSMIPTWQGHAKVLKEAA